MKTLTVRLPENLVAEIESESRSRNVSKSDVVRERLQSAGTRPKARRATFKDLAGNLIGSVKGDGLPTNLSGNKKKYLRELGYGQNRNRR